MSKLFEWDQATEGLIHASYNYLWIINKLISEMHQIFYIFSKSDLSILPSELIGSTDILILIDNFIGYIRSSTFINAVMHAQWFNLKVAMVYDLSVCY